MSAADLGNHSMTIWHAAYFVAMLGLGAGIVGNGLGWFSRGHHRRRNDEPVETERRHAANPESAAGHQ